jgi:hypothetical protein
MDEDLLKATIKIMVETWNLPESLVTDFVHRDLNLKPGADLQQLREQTAQLLQDTILRNED